MKLIRGIQKGLKDNPDKLLLEDGVSERGLTIAELDRLSGQVYAYLKQKGIGKEDRVVLLLPRSVRIPAALVGVLKAGACAVMLEKGQPEDRVSYIIKDSECRLVLDEAEWQNVLACEPLEGSEEPDLHDAAIILYTSGSTGKPKGVVHEYGSVETMLQLEYESAEVWPEGEYRRSVVAPFYFIAGVTWVLTSIYASCYAYIFSYETYKDPVLFKKVLSEKRLSVVFLTSSYVKAFDDIKTSYLKYICVGAESLGGFYRDDVKIVNCYGMTEVMNSISEFWLDKAYDVTPAGVPCAVNNVTIRDEDGNVLPVGESGEICLDNPYFRGYLHLPEETEKAKRGGVFHTNDLGYFLPDGKLVVIGRLDDMIKINGNRVEPDEIVAAFKAAFGLKWAYVKAFRRDDRTYLCAYYTEGGKIDSDRAREKLRQTLPDYMIPLFYIKMDTVPLLPSGKVDRKAFLPPDFSQLRREYVAPSTAEETVLCRSFRKVLGAEQVGVLDDFYELGGDSLKSIEILKDCGLFGLNVSDLYRERTPQRIAAYYVRFVKPENNKTPDELNAAAMKKSYPLMDVQKWLYGIQEKTPEAMEFNLFWLLGLGMIPPQLLKAALNRVIRNHPALLTTLYKDEDGNVLQKYTPEIEQKLRIEFISEKKLLEMKNELPKPFAMLNSRLYDCRIFATTKGTYWFFNVHHIITDGTSIRLFMKELMDAIKFKPLQKDYYYLTLEKLRKEKESPLYEEGKRYYHTKYPDPVPTSLARDVILEKGVERTPTVALPADEKELSEFIRIHAVSRGEFFMMVYALALAAAKKCPKPTFAWTHNGRDDRTQTAIFSCLIKEYATAVELQKDMTLSAFVDECREQVRMNIKYGCYPFAMSLIDALNDASTYIYQADLLDVNIASGKVKYVDIDFERHAGDSMIQADILDDSTGIHLMTKFNTAYYDPEVMDRFLRIYADITAKLLRHGADSAFPLKQLLAEYGYGEWAQGSVPATV